MADNFGNMTITAANCTLSDGSRLYDSPVQIEGFSTERDGQRRCKYAHRR